MAAMMIPTAAVCEIVNRLAKLVENEVVMLWSVKGELRKLKINLSEIRDVLQDAERREIQEIAVRRWLDKLRDVMFDAEDIIDDFPFNKNKLLIKGNSISFNFLYSHIYMCVCVYSMVVSIFY
ncbi:putative disease resistance RPP13-like protein 1 [Acorus calamus]|uniref:Disease resistance RPP13-like protein 1 n=1 Tax=Acorus calamus TaxID=4465 RepID=A0AAV9CQU2_ACOCL|nr:putative disease resistance RPP13-like protein 1 [Acorus calamus]